MAKPKATPAPDGGSIVDYCLRILERDERPHQLFVQEVDRRYRSYRGLLEATSDAASWTNKQHPAYAFPVVETMVASLLDPRPRFRLGVRPRFASLDEVEHYRAGVRANQLLLNEQVENDHLAEKQRPFGLQGLIAGLTIGRDSWRYEERVARSYRRVDVPLRHPVTGEQLPISIPQDQRTSQLEIVHDDPTFDVKDVRDFIWQANAVSLARSQRVIERDWFDFEELERLERNGYYENVAELKESRGQSYSSGLVDREQELHQIDRTKDKIEVLTFWLRDDRTEGGLRVVSIGNRKALLRDRPSPFFFERLEHPFPFVVCSAMPDLFQIPGISEVEMVQELQEMLWNLGNQRLDNLQLINNAVWAIDPGMEDPEGFDIYPGARNLARPDDVKMFSPDPTVASVSLEAEALIKSDLQNIPGASPALLGQLQAATGSQTATEVSLLTSLAQRRIAAKKLHFGWSYMRTGEHWLELNQQFMRSKRVIEVEGADGARNFEEIRPELLEGRYRIVPEALDESLVRQERRAEQQAKLSMFLNAAPVFAAIGQPLNGKAFMDDYLSSFDIADTERYYSGTGQQLPPGQQPQGPPGTEAAPAPGAVTAPQAANELSPSHAASLSPEVFAQRALAGRGGAVNVG